MSSVRFICGTQELHKRVERKVADFLGMDDCILFAACFDANGGVFEPFLDKDCAILTDALNHASVIDGIRLSKAERYIVNHLDMADLESKLEAAQKAKYRMVATDGVFSMDGDIAPLRRICDLAEKYDALVMVDDSHATGFMGRTGRGTHEYHDVMKRVDLITTTFGKALGGASGGCIAGHAEMIEWLRQKSRPYLFSNTLPPAVAAGTSAVMDLLSSTTELRDRLEKNQRMFRKMMTDAGFDIRPGDHPIVPIMFGRFENDAKLAQEFAARLLDEGIYVIGFSYPVVPRGQARIRVQLSAAHEEEHIVKAVKAFSKIGRELNVIGAK
jgi:glycine C-acetyltransferase